MPKNIESNKVTNKATKPLSCLYISYDGLLEPLGMSQIIPYMKGLSKHGIKFVILTFEKKNNLLKVDNIIQLARVLGSTGIIWKRLRYHKSPPVISTLVDVLYGCLTSFWLIKTKGIKLVHARSYVAGLMAIILQKLCHVRFIFDMRGFWADERVEAGIWKKGGWLYQISKHFEKILLLNSDEIISLTHTGRTEIINFPYFKNHMMNITVIPTCVDLERFNVERKSDIKIFTDWNKRVKFILIYSGSISTWYMPNEMLEFFDVAQNVIDNSYFLILTKEDELLKSILPKLKNNISILNVEHDLVPQYLSIAGVGLAFYKQGYSRKACCPTKFGEYLACGLPIIINRGIGDCDEIVLKEKVGVVINEFSSKEYERAIKELKVLLSEGDILRERCRAAAEKYFSLETGVERYWKIYRRLGRTDNENIQIFG